MKWGSIILFLSLSASLAKAEVNSEAISEVIVTEVQEDSVETFSALGSHPLEKCKSNGPIANEIGIGDIINAGKEAWKIIEAGRPVVDITEDRASAMPANINCWNQLTNWQRPKSKTYEAVYKNGFGANVVTLRYQVIYTAGGRFNGKGRYISSATIIPTKVDVAWGYDLNAKVKVENIINMGSSEDPMAGIQLRMEWTVKTVMKYSRSSINYFIDGAGALNKID